MKRYNLLLVLCMAAALPAHASQPGLRLHRLRMTYNPLKQDPVKYKEHIEDIFAQAETFPEGKEWAAQERKAIGMAKKTEKPSAPKKPAQPAAAPQPATPSGSKPPIIIDLGLLKMFLDKHKNLSGFNNWYGGTAEEDYYKIGEIRTRLSENYPQANEFVALYLEEYDDSALSPAGREELVKAGYEAAKTLYMLDVGSDANRAIIQQQISALEKLGKNKLANFFKEEMIKASEASKKKPATSTPVGGAQQPAPKKVVSAQPSAKPAAKPAQEQKKEQEGKESSQKIQELSLVLKQPFENVFGKDGVWVTLASYNPSDKDWSLLFGATNLTYGVHYTDGERQAFGPFFIDAASKEETIKEVLEKGVERLSYGNFTTKLIDLNKGLYTTTALELIPQSLSGKLIIIPVTSFVSGTMLFESVPAKGASYRDFWWVPLNDIVQGTVKERDDKKTLILQSKNVIKPLIPAMKEKLKKLEK